MRSELEWAEIVSYQQSPQQQQQPVSSFILSLSVHCTNQMSSCRRSIVIYYENIFNVALLLRLRLHVVQTNDVNLCWLNFFNLIYLCVAFSQYRGKLMRRHSRLMPLHTHTAARIF